jgi:hypothetical protein
MVLNELDAFCVVLPADLCPMTSRDHLRYLAVVHDEGVGHHPLGRGLPFEPATYLIACICRERAIDTVDAGLLVDGRRITPEKYLQRWRALLKQPVAVHELGERKRVQAVAIFQWRHSPALAARKATWVTPPYATFGELLQARGCLSTATCEVDPPAITTLEIDLAMPAGTRDAWWVNDYLSSISQGDQVITRHVELREVAGAVIPAAPHTFHERPALAAAQL